MNPDSSGDEWACYVKESEGRPQFEKNLALCSELHWREGHRQKEKVINPNSANIRGYYDFLLFFG